MDEWEIMFWGLQEIASSAIRFEDGIHKAIAFARTYPQVFDESDLWDRAETEWSYRSRDMMVGWARTGLDKMDLGTGWNHLTLELGDCPEIFCLFQPGDQGEITELQLREALFSEAIVGIPGPVEESKSWGTA